MFRLIRRIDDFVVKEISRMYNPILNKIMVFFTLIGNGAFIWWITLSFPFMIMESTRETGIFLTLALGVTFVSGEFILKPLFRRARPSKSIHKDDMIIKPPKDHSFPSGHTASSFTAVTVAVLRCPAYIFLPVIAVALIISFSRMYLRVHYFSDVVGGLILGVFNGTITIILCEQFLSPVLSNLIY
ncbi:MAG: phosphatase PAP2 family protein [Eubacteriales bacterium]|nr:phosphatase PAP2 family protein [Eubacteriales bacterium]